LKFAKGVELKCSHTQNSKYVRKKTEKKIIKVKQSKFSNKDFFFSFTPPGLLKYNVDNKRFTHYNYTIW